VYLNKKTYTIRYSDVDLYDNLKLSALLAIMQESASLSADELGFGYEDIKKKGFAFIVSNWYINLTRPIKYGENLTVSTWPLKPGHLIFLRDFELFIGEEKVGVATSRWCLIDLERYAILPSKAFFETDEREYNDFRSIEFNKWKIPQLDGGEAAFFKRVSYTDYDHYNHVNNTKYADFAIDAFSPEELKNKFISTAQVSYVKQCKMGEEFTVLKSRQDDGSVLIEGRVQGELRTQFKFTIDEYKL